VRALACPASLKGVLRATAAAEALVAGFRATGLEAEALPVADGGEGTAEVLEAALGGEWQVAGVRDAFTRPREARWLLLPCGTAVLESAAAVPLDPSRLDPFAASSRGFGELILHALRERPVGLLLCLGGTATMDGGAGLREVLSILPVPARALYDVRTPLLEAPAVFGPQKGASAGAVAELERRLAADGDLQPYAKLPGSGAAGGLGAALALLGAELLPGAPYILDAIDFDARVSGADLVVTGEGTVDASTAAGKAPAAVAAAADRAGVRCVVFGGRVLEPLPGVETLELSGDKARAADDLRELAALLGRAELLRQGLQELPRDP
jgi:glycerate 2-kinase